MFKWLGLLYGSLKSCGEILGYEERNKLVDLQWLRTSGFSEKCRDWGYELAFSRPARVKAKRIEGWDVLYEVDLIRNIRRRIILKDGSLLIGRLQESSLGLE